MNNNTEALKIDVISDVMCPWCYIGMKRLDEATESLPDDFALEIHWRPFQLDATLPKEGKDRAQYLNDKFGGPAGAAEVYHNIQMAGAEAGIDFNFEAMTVSPNTLDAHRVIKWAGEQSAATQNAVVRQFFIGFFERGAHLGEDKTLISLAKDAGMDTTGLAERLASNEDQAQTQEEAQRASQMGVTGVPCFIVENKYAIMGAQPAETLLHAFKDIAKQKAEGTLHDETKQ